MTANFGLPKTPLPFEKKNHLPLHPLFKKKKGGFFFSLLFLSVKPPLDILLFILKLSINWSDFIWDLGGKSKEVFLWYVT